MGCSFERGSDIINEITRISKSQSKSIKFEDYYICLFGGEYQRECGIYVLCSIENDMCLKKYVNLHFHFLMRNVDISMKLKAYLGNNFNEGLEK